MIQPIVCHKRLLTQKERPADESGKKKSLLLQWYVSLTLSIGFKAVRTKELRHLKKRSQDDGVIWKFSSAVSLAKSTSISLDCWTVVATNMKNNVIGPCMSNTGYMLNKPQKTHACRDLTHAELYFHSIIRSYFSRNQKKQKIWIWFRTQYRKRPIPHIIVIQCCASWHLLSRMYLALTTCLCFHKRVK